MNLVALIPKSISNASLIASSVAQPDPARVMPDGTVGEEVWVSGDTYAEGDRVIRTGVRRTFRRTAVTGSLTAAPERSPLLWIDEGPTNRWAWADAQAVSRTVSESPYTLTVKPGVCNDIELYGLENVDTVEISMLDESGGSIVFALESSTDEYASTDPHWSFYFEGPTQGYNFSVTDLPLYPDGEITITLSSYDGEDIGVGLIAFGSYESLGLPLYGFETVYRNYGYTVTDRWGNAQLVPGAKGKDLRGTCFIEAAEANGIDSTVRRLLDVGAIFVPSPLPEHRYLKTWGQIKPARIQAAGPTHAIVEIEIEGLI